MAGDFRYRDAAQALLGATWFRAGLVTIDTFLVTAIIYLSGNARSDLYIAYFVFILVARQSDG
ncbi:MAG: hypothetical protein P0120_07660 [Nitrospira sp.]|nr:hypothetical protein [Nitrospira sp.]